MPYKEKWSDLVWNSLQVIGRLDTRHRLRIRRVDQEVPEEDHLHAEIEARVSEAHIVIADVTNNNPNVHIEIGYAIARKIPVFIITQDRASVPAHLRSRIVGAYSRTDKQSRIVLAESLFHRIEEKIKDIEKGQERENIAIGVRNEYSVTCYVDRTAVKLQDYFRKANEHIDILTTNLAFLFEKHDSNHTYFDEIESALRRSAPDSKSALNRGSAKLKVRILTLDPESDFAAKRGKQLGQKPAVFRNELRKALKRTLTLARKYRPMNDTDEGDRFQVRTYEDFPNQITYRTDNWVFNCVVAQPTRSRDHLTFKLDTRHAGVKDSFLTHFDSVWRDGQSIT